MNRRRRGSALAISGLWPWGGGQAAAPAAPPAPAGADSELHGGDLFAMSLARQCGVDLIPSEGMPPVASSLRDSFAVLSVHGSDVYRAMQECEARWLQPALHAWRAGVCSLLHLVSDDRVWTLAPRDRWRFWRRARPWTDGLLRC